MEGFVRYMKARSLSEATINRRLAAIRSFERTLDGVVILEATPGHVEDWLATLRSAATKAHYRSDVNMFYRWAVRRELLERNPVDLTDAVRCPRAMPRPLPGPVIATALTVAEPTTRLAIMLGAYAGLRVGEIAAMHMDDVHLGAMPVLVVREGKGGKDRAVPLHPLLMQALMRRPAGWLFPNALGEDHLRTPAIRRRITAAFSAIGVPMTSHQLRHAMATELARVTNGNLLLVAHVLGHESVITTSGYTKFAMGPETLAIGRLWEEDSQS